MSVICVGGFLWVHRFPPAIWYYILHHVIKFVSDFCRWFSVDTPVSSRYRALYPTSREKACGFYPRSGQTKEYKIVIFCFSTKHTVLRSKCKDCLTRNQDNISEWRGMSTRGLFFQRTKRVGLVQSRHQHHLIECNLFSPWHSNLPLTLSNIIYHTTQNLLFPFGYSLLLHKLIILNWLSVNVSLYPTIMLSMVLFSILVIVLLFEANLCNFLIVYLWRPIYQDRRFGIPLTSLSPSHICACPKTGHGFLTSYVVVFV